MFLAVAPSCCLLGAAEPVRTWHFQNGNSLDAALLKDAGSNILLRAANGRTGTVNVAILSGDDLAYLKALKTPAPPKLPEVVVIYNTEFQAAEAIVELLNENQLKARMQSSLTIGERPSFGAARLLIIARDAAENFSEQAAAPLIRDIMQTKRAVLTLGLTGYRLYSRMELSMGKSPVAFTGDSALLQQTDDAVFQTPNAIAIETGAPFRLYEKQNTVYGVFLEPKPDYVLALANTVDQRVGYMSIAIEDHLYGWWGYSGSPRIMTEQGRQLFVNMVHRLITASPVQDAEETPPPAEPEQVAEPPPRPQSRPAPEAAAPQTAAAHFYAPGREPSYPAKSLDKYQVYPTSKDARAASAIYDIELTVHTVDTDVTVTKSSGQYYQSKNSSGNFRYCPMVRITARNKDVAANSLLAIEYYRRPVDGYDRTRAGVQHIVLPEIKRGSSVLLEAPGISLFKSESKTSYGNSASGFELAGVVLGLFDAEQKLLFQVATQQSLRDMASPTLLPADL